MQRDTVSKGQEFGYWIILEELPLTRGRTRKFLCKCRCGKEKEVFYSHLKHKKSKSCGCKGPRRQYHSKWKGCGEISGAYWSRIVCNANGKRGRLAVGIDITIQDGWQLFLKQERKCALSNKNLTFNDGYAGWTASLDRIDPSIGYTQKNVQWVHKDINRMKNIFQNEYFIRTCQEIAKHTGNSDRCEITADGA